jgi:hypothetical protein
LRIGLRASLNAMLMTHAAGGIRMTRQFEGWLAVMLTLGVVSAAADAQPYVVSTNFGNGADIELTENGGAGGAATAGGNGTKTNMNARWNFANVPPANPDRNEWAAMRFDLSEYEDKGSIVNVTLNAYMHRGNSNNNKNLRFYTISPGTEGEDWAESGTTYETMPGFTFDADSTTNVLDVGGAIIELGTFATTDVEAEGALATITLPSLTTLIQQMGSNNLLTVLITTAGSTNGQWRALTKEASGSEFGAISGNVGDFAPFLQFDLSDGSGLAGDYNGDGFVDAADYTVWRNHLNEPDETNLNNNGDGGGVGPSDYDLWKSQYGQGTPAGGGGLAASVVPEPTTLAICLVLALVNSLCMRRNTTRR